MKYQPTRPLITRCIILLGLVIGYYIIDNLSLFSFLDFSVYNVVVKPIYWSFVILISLTIPSIRAESKIRMRENIYFWAILHGFIYVIVWFAAGFIDGFGKNPHNLTLPGIAQNFIVVGTMLAGKELIRNHLVRNTARKDNFLVLFLITIFFTVESFNINKYSGLTSLKEAVQFIAEFFAPSFARNMMATYLSFLGGPLASLCYLSIYNLFLYFCPILPNAKWITMALVGILCPVFSLMSIQDMYNRQTKLIKKSIDKKEGLMGWVITSLFSILVVWFALGVFTVYPTVIATGSMEPLIRPGDVILVDKRGRQDVQLGDIIQFDRDGILISHRVVELIADKEYGTLYRTKGDNNSGVDSRLVKPNEIKGKVIYVVPKIGWPTLLLKSRDYSSSSDIEF